MIARRTLFAATLAVPSLARAQTQARLLRFIPQGNLANIDPVWSTTVISRNHGLMIYDMLFGLGADFRPKHQMAQSHEVSADGLLWRIALRPGLLFHDGAPVRSADCIASILRWSKRDVLGLRLNALLEEARAESDSVFTLRLKRPWPGLAYALGKPGANICAIMPERVARTDPFKQIDDYTGSGPYVFRQAQWVPGSLAAYDRFEGYRSREEAPDFLAGGKPVHFDRVEWRVMPDPATAMGALLNNEADWWETPLGDLLPRLKRDRNIEVAVVNTAGNLGVLRFNHLQPPFDNPAVRRALLPAIDQRAFMQAAYGDDPALWQVPAGAFTPGTPLANEVGLDALTGPRSLEAAQRRLRESGYKGERVAMMTPTDLANINALSEVAADLMRRVGFNVDLQATDWGTAIQRRGNRGPVEQGGWSAFCTTWEGLDVSVPGSHQPLRGNGAEGWAGWSSSPRREALREAWFNAASPEEERRIAGELQALVWEEAPFIPLGQGRPPQAWRRSLSGHVLGGPALFWGVRKAA